MSPRTCESIVTKLSRFPKIKLIAFKCHRISEIFNGSFNIARNIFFQAIEHYQRILFIPRLPVDGVFWFEGIIKFCHSIRFRLLSGRLIFAAKKRA